MKLKQTLIILALCITTLGLVVAPAALAVPLECGGVPTSVVSCPQTGSGSIEQSGIWGILILVINILSVGVGIAAVGGVVYGSILYTTAGGGLDQTKKARAIIANTVVGIVLYIAMWALLNYMIPGGIFKL